MVNNKALLTGLGLLVLIGGLVAWVLLGGGGATPVKVEWKDVGNGESELVVDSGERKVTAVKLEGEGGLTSIKTNTRDGLVVEVANKIEEGNWKWGAVVMGSVEKLERGKQVWATAKINGQKPKISGTVVVAEDGNKPAEEIKIGGGNDR